jgi:hypothetical protein
LTRRFEDSAFSRRCSSASVYRAIVRNDSDTVIEFVARNGPAFWSVTVFSSSCRCTNSKLFFAPDSLEAALSTMERVPGDSFSTLDDRQH